jgi:nicotinamidase-related amidase
VLVDLQYLDAHRAYGFGKSLRRRDPRAWRYYFKRIEDAVVPNTLRLLHAFREQRMRVIYLTLGAELPDAADFGGPDVAIVRPARPGGATTVYYKGAFEHEIIPPLAPVDGELVVNKTSRSAFTSTALERTLLNLHIRTLVIAGVATGSCVDLTARDAIDRGFHAVIVEDATADLDDVLHRAALRQFAFRWGHVWTCAETLRALRRGAGARRP